VRRLFRTTKLKSIKALIIDMDGVIWRGEEPIGDLPFIFSEFDRRGVKIILATNNATLSVDQYLKKLSRFGVRLESWQIINSPLAVAIYLHKQFPQGGPVFNVGEEGLVNTLLEFGFYQADRDILAVIVGLDRGLTYDKLKQAALLIRSGKPFIATNPDRTLPTPQGFVPGAGSILAALEAATDVKPVVIGKPSPEMYRVALERLGITPNEVLVVGDRLETDIAGAQALGCYTALVLTGVSSIEDAARWNPQPDLIVDELSSVLEVL